MSKASSSPLILYPRLLSVAQAATYLGRTPAALRQLVYRGLIPCVRLGGRRLQFDREDLDRLIDASKFRESL